MIESAARAERLETQAAASPCYVWEVPQKPISIRVSLDLIDRLDREVVATFRSVRSRGSEIGGLLLGKNVPGTPSTVVVEEFEPIPCDYSRGPLYRLGESDMQRFDSAIQKRAAAASGLVLVGLFRSNTRKGLGLEPEDLAFFNERCPDPQHIYLLIKPFATKASTAGLFFRENGTVHADASYLEFPFDCAELMKRVAEGTAQVSGPPAAKSAPRAQVVPIAVKRDLPAAPEEPAPAPAAAVKPAEQPAAPAKPSAPQAKQSAPPATPDAPTKQSAPPATPGAPQAKQSAPPARPDTPQAKQSASPATPGAPQAKQSAPPATPGASQAKQAVAPSKPAAEPAKKPVGTAPAPGKASAAPAPAPAEQPAQPARIVEAPAISFGSAPVEDGGGKGKLIWILGGAAAIIAIFLLLVYPGFLLRRSRPEAPVAKMDMAALALRAERNAGQLILTWNREAQVVKIAKKAMLAISDGTQRENVDIDLAQLQNGSIVYTPVTADVSFRLEVTGPDGKPQSEYVRVLGNRPSAMPADTNAAPGAVARNASNANQPAAGNAQQVEAAQASEPAPEPAPEPSTPRASLAERLRPAKPSELKELALAEPPKLEQRQPAAGMSFGLGQTANVPPPVSAPARPSSSASQQQLKVGGRVREATLVKRVEPTYPALARQARVRGTVQLEATVGRDGRVRDVRVVAGHPLLKQAAVDAVKQWIYTPSLLNGAPVEVVTKIEVGFNFQGN